MSRRFDPIWKKPQSSYKTLYCGCDPEDHRNSPINWYEKEFTVEEVLQFKENRERKNREVGFYSNLDIKSDLRWIGEPGELTFKEYLDELGLEYKHWTNTKTADERDFTVGDLEIDVKTISCYVYPHGGVAASVNAKQIARIEEKGIVNAFVWARYIIPENKCVLVGFLPKHIFDQKRKLTPAGTVFKNGKVSNTDMLSVKVDCLLPTIELDRFKGFNIVIKNEPTE